MQAFSQKSYNATQNCQMRVYIDERTRILTREREDEFFLTRERDDEFILPSVSRLDCRILSC